jgi:uncharacterized protein YjdB
MNDWENGFRTSGKGKYPGDEENTTSIVDGDNSETEAADPASLSFVKMQESDKVGAGRAPEPPHNSFDDTVINEINDQDSSDTPPADDLKWVKIDSSETSATAAAETRAKTPKHVSSGSGKLSSASKLVILVGVIFVAVLVILFTKNPKPQQSAAQIPAPVETVQASETPVPEETPVVLEAINVPKIMLLKTGSSAEIQVEASPAGASISSVSVKADNAAVVKADGAKLTGLKDGRTYVTVTADGFKASCLMLVNSFDINKASSQPVTNCGWYYQVGKDGIVGDLFFINGKYYWLSSSAPIDAAQTKRLGQIATAQLGSWRANTVLKRPWAEYYSDSGKKTVLGQLAIVVDKDKKVFVVVHKGIVTVAPEKASITSYAAEKTYTKPTVKSDPSAVKSVWLNHRYFDTKTIGSSIQLTASVSPSTAKNKTVKWSSSNSSVATVNSSGTVVAVGAGKAVIYATAGGKSASCTVVVDTSTVN